MGVDRTPYPEAGPRELGSSLPPQVVPATR